MHACLCRVLSPHGFLVTIAGLVMLLFCHPLRAGDDAEWVSLFDGKKLGKWEPSGFATQGNVGVENQNLVVKTSYGCNGVTWTGKMPRIDYEIELDAMRTGGADFFCGLTFPVGDDPCTLIVGGWGGGMVGLSSLDELDASENETSKWMEFDNNRWYHIRVRVTPVRIAAWIDEKQVINVLLADRKISIRIEVEESKPLGLATWHTSAAFRDIRLRELPDKRKDEGGRMKDEPAR